MSAPQTSVITPIIMQGITPIIMQGDVVVRGEIRHVWRSRKFILTNDGKLSYQSQHANSPTRHVQILHARKYSSDEQSSKKSSLPYSTFGFVFYAISDGYSRVYHCSVPTSTLRAEWVAKLSQQAVAASKSFSPSSSTTSASVYNFQVLRRKNTSQNSSGWLKWKKLNTLSICVEYKINVVHNVDVPTSNLAGSWIQTKQFREFGKLIESLKSEFSTKSDAYPKILEQVSNIFDKENSFSWKDATGVHAIINIRKRITSLNDILKLLLNDQIVGHSFHLKQFLMPSDTQSNSDGDSDSAEPNTSEWVVLDDDANAEKASSFSSSTMPSSNLAIPMLVALLVILLGMVSSLNFSVTINSDHLVLLVFAIFSIGKSVGSHGLGLGLGLGPSPPPPQDPPPTTIRQNSRDRRATILGSPMLPRQLSVAGKTAPLEGLGSPLPAWPSESSSYSEPDATNYKVRGETYLKDKKKVASAPSAFKLRGVDLWLTDNALHNVARHPSMLGGKLRDKPTFIINFLLPWGNFAAYFEIPTADEMKAKPLPFQKAWKHFLKGSDKERAAKLKMLTVCIEGLWIVRKTIGPGSSPTVVGKVMPLEFHESGERGGSDHLFEVSLVIISSRIARGILSVVKNHASGLVLDFAFVLEGVSANELPEAVLGAFRIHNLDPIECSELPEFHEESGLSTISEREEEEDE